MCDIGHVLKHGHVPHAAAHQLATLINGSLQVHHLSICLNKQSIKHLS